MSNDAEARARACLDATRHSPECYMAVPSLMDADDRCDCDREIRAMLTFAAEARSHDGEWVLVPKKPTAAMIEAFGDATGFDFDGDIRDGWSAMVSAVPLDEGPI